MAEKTSTLILKVDLECYRCHKKISRILLKLQDRENIKTISYDEKNNTVTISGPFDPQKLSAKLSCRAGKVIKDIQIKENKEKEKEKPKESKPAEKEKEKPKKEEKPAEKEKAPEKEKEKKPAEPEKKPEKKEEKKPEKKEEKPAKSEPEAPKQSETVQAPQPVCCPAPYYEGYYGGCRCCACGHIFGYVAGPPYGGPYNAPPYDGYRVYCYEEYPSASTCTIM